MKWSARTICTFIAASVPVEKAGDVNPLMDAATKIGLDAEQIKQQDEAPPPVKENSFEAFMASFGSPSRWAGAN